MGRVVGSPFRIDWTDREAVIEYAKKLGVGNVVYKHPARNNYNITHKVNDTYKSEWIVYEVEG